MLGGHILQCVLGGCGVCGPVDPPSLSTCARPATVIGGPLGEIECQHELMRKSEVLRRDDVILSSLSLNVMCVTFFS